MEGGIAVVTLGKEPVNSMDFDFWKSLRSTMVGLEGDKQVRAVIFQSGLKKNVFTAGLDIKELFTPMTNKQRQNEFWTNLTETLIGIYSSRLVTIAAIKGACPAGGCALSLCCDFRIITSDGSMGLNEVALGIPVPTYWVEFFRAAVGQRQAEKLLESADMPKAPKLLEIGMVDEVVNGVDALIPAAVKEAQRWLQGYDKARHATKMVLRGDLTKRWTAGIQAEADLVWDMTSAPETVAGLKKTLERLSGGKKPPAAKL